MDQTFIEMKQMLQEAVTRISTLEQVLSSYQVQMEQNKTIYDSKIETINKTLAEQGEEILALKKENKSLKLDLETSKKKVASLENQIGDEGVVGKEASGSSPSCSKNQPLDSREESLREMVTQTDIENTIPRTGFNVRLGHPEPLESRRNTHLSQCERIYVFGNQQDLFTDDGRFRAKEDGVYAIGWRMVQEGHGSLELVLTVVGVVASNVGKTDHWWDVASGVMLLPIKAGQDVGLFVYCGDEEDAWVFKCNLIGWMVAPCVLGSLEEVESEQRKIFLH